MDAVVLIAAAGLFVFRMGTEKPAVQVSVPVEPVEHVAQLVSCSSTAPPDAQAEAIASIGGVVSNGLDRFVNN
ncbi:hypothetical protein T492DRAFT_866883 [Pavlovales sp. CCMP2436]|nr:hypothetical protein T492DRAFT_866883 [Pavlovales sp. CCMP2436]